MRVVKFGGASFNDLASLRRVVSILKIRHTARGTRPIVIVSAGRKITDDLIEMAELALSGSSDYEDSLLVFSSRYEKLLLGLGDGKEKQACDFRLKTLFDKLRKVLHGIFLLREASSRTLDFIMSFGELVSSVVMFYALTVEEQFPEVELLDVTKFIVTDDNWGAANVNFEETYIRIRKHFSVLHPIQVIPGFIGATSDGFISTLGRGGSDYTASIFGAALGAEEIELWTLVDGVMTADPLKVISALSIENLSYEEAIELSHLGSRLFFPPTLQPAKDNNTPIRVLNINNLNFKGTLISNREINRTHAITGISSLNEIALLRLEGSGLVGTSFVSRLFACLSRAGVNVIFVSQGSSEYSICIAFLAKQIAETKKAVENEFFKEILARKLDEVVVEEGLSIISAVGENMKKMPGIAARLFGALSRNGISVSAIAQGSSELNISVVVSSRDSDKALRAIHDAFFLSNLKAVNLFVIGTGQVGCKLLDQILETRATLAANHSLDLRVIGLANSKRFAFCDSGIDLSSWQGVLEASNEAMNIDIFIERMTQMNLPNCIFVDCTASSVVASRSVNVLNSSISVVTPNKKANSANYGVYKDLRMAVATAHAKFFYETTVGAGLPIIGTLKDLLLSGDQVLKIEAVLSGTLSYIFNTYSCDCSFSEVVRRAKDLGYTEPDPRDDLGGVDVARKLLILAREIGLSFELSDIQVESLIPTGGENCKTVESFMQILPKFDAEFAKKRDAAATSGCVLRYIAALESGRASVSLQAVSPEHPFYALSGSDNIISFTTKRYKDRPLVVKGPGAGTDVTAAGVLADIVRAASYFVTA